MNRQQGMVIVEGRRRAQAAGAPVVELKGKDARNFAFVKDEASRQELLGSFGVEAGKKFFVSVVSSPSNDDDYSFAVFERFKGNPPLASNLVDPGGVVWKYQPSKQYGSNQARKKTFFEAAKSDSITIPFPTEDISAFSAAVTRAIDLRHLADAAGGTGADDEEAPSDETNASDLLTSFPISVGADVGMGAARPLLLASGGERALACPLTIGSRGERARGATRCGDGVPDAWVRVPPWGGSVARVTARTPEPSRETFDQV